MATLAESAEAGGIAADTGTGEAAPAAERIEALDFVRGVALFGILLMNITAFGLAESYMNPTNAGGATGANLWAWIVTQIGFEGTQRALFSMLFGASVILFTTRLEAQGRTDVGDIYVRRNLWLVGFGLANAWILLWEGDILYSYGITALFLFPFRRLSARALLILGFATLIANAAWNLHDTGDTIAKHDAYVAAMTARQHGARPTEAQAGAIEAWQTERGYVKSAPAAIREENAHHRAGYLATLREVAPANMWAQSRGLYRYFFDVFSMMLIGMALYKQGVLTGARRARVYWAMLLAGYAIGLCVNAMETKWIVDHGFSALAFAEANVSYDLGRLAMSVGHLGALLLFVKSGRLSWLRRAFAAVGRMAVTNYLAHSAVCLILFTGFGLFGALERYQLYYVVLAIWAAQLVVSPLWLRHFRFGPVEWLWRSLTYMKRQPMRRPKMQEAAA